MKMDRIKRGASGFSGLTTGRAALCLACGLLVCSTPAAATMAGGTSQVPEAEPIVNHADLEAIPSPQDPGQQDPPERDPAQDPVAKSLGEQESEQDPEQQEEEAEGKTGPAQDPDAEDPDQQNRQDPDDPAPDEPVILGPEESTTAEQQAMELVMQIMEEQRASITGTDFSYSADGRRDPFRSLLALRARTVEAPGERPPGLTGLLINKVTVVAVAQYQGRWYAMITGPAKRTHFAEVGDELYDGRLVQIDAAEVQFEQEVVDMIGARSIRMVSKQLDGQQ